MRTIVIRLTDSSYDGQWRVIEGDDFEVIVPPGTKIPMVPTGAVEWDGDQCAEVWVTKDRLPLWQAKHDVNTA